MKTYVIDTMYGEADDPTTFTYFVNAYSKKEAIDIVKNDPDFDPTDSIVFCDELDTKHYGVTYGISS